MHGNINSKASFACWPSVGALPPFPFPPHQIPICGTFLERIQAVVCASKEGRGSGKSCIAALISSASWDQSINATIISVCSMVLENRVRSIV